MAERQIQEHGPTDPDELTLAQTTERVVWSLPGDEGILQQDAALPGSGYDYSGGMLVGGSAAAEADAQATALHARRLVAARVDAPKSYEVPHEALHRRYEPARVIPIAQSAIGTLMFAQPQFGLHIVKLVALTVTLSAAGTLQFVQGDPGGASTAPIGSTQGTSLAGGMGALSLAASTPLVLPPAELANPWMWTTPDLALGLVTTGTGAFANGWAIVAYSPYET